MRSAFGKPKPLAAERHPHGLAAHVTGTVGLLALLTSMAGCAASQGAGEGARAVTQIHVITPTAWWLRIHGDGSAAYGHGAEDGTPTAVPAGVFDAAEIARAFELRTVDTGDMADDYSVLIVRRGDTQVKSRYVKSAELIGPLFERARGRRTKANAESDAAWERTPPVEEKSEVLPPVRIGV